MIFFFFLNIRGVGAVKDVGAHKVLYFFSLELSGIWSRGYSAVG